MLSPVAPMADAHACIAHLQGFDHELVGAVSDAVTIPVIASSGAGVPEHFTKVGVSDIQSLSIIVFSVLDVWYGCAILGEQALWFRKASQDCI